MIEASETQGAPEAAGQAQHATQPASHHRTAKATGQHRMKTATATLAALLLVVAVLATGCANNQGKSVLLKSTVLGMEVSPGASAPGAPALRVGLVRNTYVAVPTNATLKADSEGDLRASRQTASESLFFGPHLMPIPAAQTNAHTAPPSVTASLTNTVRVKAK